ncbi:hypothetical protein CLV44_10884 [Marinobacterium halophilum]|uniref:Sporulation related protein n=1 Tax=Marinobacterium halophilum TaxID=267374 RepID=A0A2P8EY58_9GAMM|nr:hypothetical protein [Marinobacterium halophilum]PSL14355.1 hypothetical protein CLV44_10884 [Marinobacterium halophilum]
MLRWLALLLLLMNALVLLWYAQQQEGERVTVSTEEISRLHLLHELGGGESLQPRASECHRIGLFASPQEALRAAERLQERGFDAEVHPAPAAVIGYRLVLPRPADAAAELSLLDQLALAGWVPQTESGHFVLGPFLGEQARQEADIEQAAIASVLELTAQRQPIRDSVPLQQIFTRVPEAQNVEQRLQQILAGGWPGIKIEKKLCEGVAHPQQDQ